jgi:hypothetical protein
MIEVKWTKKKRIINLIKQVDRLNNQSASYGYFKEQGNHPESPHLTLPELMGIHELREKGDPLRRPVFEISLERSGDEFNNYNLSVVKDYIDKSGLNKKPSPRTVLDKIALKGIEITKPTFGDPSILEWNTDNVIRSKGGRNTPMVEFGILKESLAYKTSLRKSIKKTY